MSVDLTQSPLYQQPSQTTKDAIKARMVQGATTLGSLDLDIGSWEDDAMAVAAQELTQAANLPQRLYKRVFAATATGADLDALADQTGITPRLAAVAAQGLVTFNGPAGTAVAAGTRVATLLGVTYSLQAALVIPVGSTSFSGNCIAVLPGAGGNQPAGAVVSLVSNAPGITSVTNTVAMTGGADAETDDSLRARIKQARSEKGVSGNRAEIRTAALAVAGVGGVEVMYANQGSVPGPVAPGDVRVTLTDTTSLPVSTTTREAVRDALSEPWRYSYQASLLTLSAGAVVVNNQADSIYGASVHLPPATAAEIVQQRVDNWLPQATIWELRPVMKVVGPFGAGNLVQVGLWDISAAAWAKTTPTGTTDALFTLPETAIGTSFAEVYVGDAWANPLDQLELRIIRQNAAGNDVTSDLYVDGVNWRSATQREDVDNFLPGFVRLRVQAAAQVNVDFVVTVTYVSGFDPASVRSAIRAALVAYLAGLPFGTGLNRLVQAGAMGDAVFRTAGVASYDFSSLTINGAQANISVLPEQVPVLRYCTISGVAV